MIRWNVAPLMERKKLANASQLAAFAKLTKPTAARVLSGEPLERIEVATLEALAEAFNVRKHKLLDFGEP